MCKLICACLALTINNREKNQVKQGLLKKKKNSSLLDNAPNQVSSWVHYPKEIQKIASMTVKLVEGKTLKHQYDLVKILLQQSEELFVSIIINPLPLARLLRHFSPARAENYSKARRLDKLFCQIITLIKVRVAFVFGLQTL